MITRSDPNLLIIGKRARPVLRGAKIGDGFSLLGKTT